MVSRFGSPDPNWQFARKLARRRFTTRPRPISNFCTYANLRQICTGINRAMSPLMTDTRAAEKTKRSSLISLLQVQVKSAMRGKVKGGCRLMISLIKSHSVGLQ